jgi:hypothetical protein
MTDDIKKAAMRVLDELALRRQLQEQRVRLGLEPPPSPPPPTPEQEAERLQCQLLLSRLALSRARRTRRDGEKRGGRPLAGIDEYSSAQLWCWPRRE